MSYHSELESRAMEGPSWARKELIAERNKLRKKIERGKEVSTLKILAAALHVVKPTSFAAYKLRNILYALLKARGISANHTYPKYDPLVVERGDSRPVSTWTPVTFRHYVTQ
jgi:hypothetical protein